MVKVFVETDEQPIRFSWKLQKGPMPAEGDLFWVQEEFCAHWGKPAPGGVPAFGFSVAQAVGSSVIASSDDPLHVYYRIDQTKEPFPHLEWLPAETMNRWASRLTLQLKHVVAGEGGFDCVFEVLKRPIRDLSPLPLDVVH